MVWQGVAENRSGTIRARAQFHHFQWVFGNVYHCPEVGMEVH